MEPVRREQEAQAAGAARLRMQEELAANTARRWVRYLHRHGVELLDYIRMRLSCMSCKQACSPNLGSGGRLPRGYWKCPNDCNIDGFLARIAFIGTVPK